MQTNYLSIIPVISKFEIPKGFGVIDKNVQNVATVHMLCTVCTQPAERCNPMTSQWNSPGRLACTVSKWSLRQDLLLKLRNLELESLTCLSLSSKSCLKLHLETGPCYARQALYAGIGLSSLFYVTL